jgi:arylsulfatase A-like enzyme
MNVITIMNDTFRRDHVGAYGLEAPWANPGTGHGYIHTPNLDDLASQGVLFDRFYAGSYPTIPTRYDLWSGRFGFPTRPWQPLEPDDASLPEILAAAGHPTMLIHDTPALTAAGYNFQRGFTGWERVRGQHGDRWRTDPGDLWRACAPHKYKNHRGVQAYLRNMRDRRHEAEWMAGKTVLSAIDWLERNASHRDFYLYVDMWDPHEPFDAPVADQARYEDSDFHGDWLIYPAYGRGTYMTADERAHVRASYAALCTYADRWIGHLLEAIDRLGLGDDTLVIWLTDHGHSFGDHDLQGKPGGQLGRLYDPNVRCPMLIRHPGGTGAGTRTDALCQHVDIFATVLDALGIDSPTEIDGRSLLPLMRGEVSQHRKIAFSGRGVPVGKTVTDAARDGYLRRDDLADPITISDGAWQLLLSPQGHVSELYDLSDDPDQDHNILNSHRDEAIRLQHHALDFLASHNAADARIAPFEAEPSTTPATEPLVVMGPDAPLFAFTDTNNVTIAVPSEADAIEFSHGSPGSSDVRKLTLKDLAPEGRRAHIGLDGQYAWPEDLLPPN